jgi:hypothetical protein
MKTLLIALGLMLLTATAFAQIKYISGYTRGDGTSVSGHYRDTSNDGNPYNNANYLGYND